MSNDPKFEHIDVAGEERVHFVADSQWFFKLFPLQSLLFKLFSPPQGSDQPQSDDDLADANSGSNENLADGNNEVPSEPMETDKNCAHDISQP
jgi:hypothetical protein